MNYYTIQELKNLGLKSVGYKVMISRDARLYNPELIMIGNNVRIDDFCILSGNISIGSHTHIAPFCGLYGGDEDAGIEVGSFGGFSSRTALYAVSDDYSGDYLGGPVIPEEYRNVQKGKVLVGDYAGTGTGATVFPGVEMKTGTVLGSMSMLYKPRTTEWTIYFGIPARPIEKRTQGKVQLAEKFKREFNSMLKSEMPNDEA